MDVDLPTVVMSRCWGRAPSIGLDRKILAPQPSAPTVADCPLISLTPCSVGISAIGDGPVHVDGLDSESAAEVEP